MSTCGRDQVLGACGVAANTIYRTFPPSRAQRSPLAILFLLLNRCDRVQPRTVVILPSPICRRTARTQIQNLPKRLQLLASQLLDGIPAACRSGTDCDPRRPFQRSGEVARRTTSFSAAAACGAVAAIIASEARGNRERSTATFATVSEVTAPRTPTRLGRISRRRFRHPQGFRCPLSGPVPKLPEVPRWTDPPFDVPMSLPFPASSGHRC